MVDRLTVPNNTSVGDPRRIDATSGSPAAAMDGYAAAGFTTTGAGHPGPPVDPPGNGTSVASNTFATQAGPATIPGGPDTRGEAALVAPSHTTQEDTTIHYDEEDAANAASNDIPEASTCHIVAPTTGPAPATPNNIGKEVAEAATTILQRNERAATHVAQDHQQRADQAARGGGPVDHHPGATAE